MLRSFQLLVRFLCKAAGPLVFNSYAGDCSFFLENILALRNISTLVSLYLWFHTVTVNIWIPCKNTAVLGTIGDKEYQKNMQTDC